MPERSEQIDTIEVLASPEACYKVICDFEAYPEWQSNVEKVKILKKDGDGRPTRVEFLISVMGRKVRYVLDYVYRDMDFTISWTFVEGDIRDTSGSYSFRKKGAKKTLTTYSLAVDLGFWIPQFMLNTLSKIGMIDTLHAFKARVEEL